METACIYGLEQDVGLVKTADGVLLRDAFMNFRL